MEKSFPESAVYISWHTRRMPARWKTFSYDKKQIVTSLVGQTFLTHFRLLWDKSVEQMSLGGLPDWLEPPTPLTDKIIFYLSL